MHLLQENARLYSLFIESYAAAMTIDTDKLAPPPEAANDTLIINGLDGVDAFGIGAGVTALIQLILNQ